MLCGKTYWRKEMPDFERVIDQFRVDMAEGPEERARAEGFNAGKRYARKEIVVMVAFLVFVASFIAACAVWVAV